MKQKRVETLFLGSSQSCVYKEVRIEGNMGYTRFEGDVSEGG